jgi:hypothetical protein
MVKVWLFLFHNLHGSLQCCEGISSLQCFNPGICSQVVMTRTKLAQDLKVSVAWSFYFQACNLEFATMQVKHAYKNSN